ncbi:hypothetical protein HYT26_02265 [Candidatus Pacearchaeota archaeon]|nr:hypothetical protein [Candidatus Pacearchaeota archaeon]
MEKQKEVYVKMIHVETGIVVSYSLNNEIENCDVTSYIDHETIRKLNDGAKKTIFIKRDTDKKDVGIWCYDNNIGVPSGILPELKNIEEKFFKNIKLN